MGLLTEINIFTIFWLVILPIPSGYLLKIIKASFNGFDELPDYNDWKLIYLDGVKLIAVVLIYALPVILFLLLNNAQILPIDLSNFSILNLWTFFMGPQLLIFIAIGFLEYMAIANMALYEGEIIAAFSFREIFKRISMIGWKEYLTYYIIIWILALITGLISFLAVLILIGIVITPLVIVPYFMILNSRFLALIFASSADVELKKG
jgi:hypothetical protein